MSNADNTIALMRIAEATERIADALERDKPVRVDIKTLSNAIMNETLKKAVRR